MILNLIGRLETGNPQGRWLGYENAAKFLGSIQTKIEAIEPGKALDFDLPAGLGQVLKNASGEVATEAAIGVRVV